MSKSYIYENDVKADHSIWDPFFKNLCINKLCLKILFSKTHVSIVTPKAQGKIA